MFQYAAGRGVATRLGVNLLLDLSWFNQATDRSFLLDKLCVEAKVRHREIGRDAAPSSRMRRRLLSRIFGRSASETSRIYSQPGFHFDETIFGIKPGTLLIGYFQSERFFIHIAEEIRAAFRPREPLSEYSAAIRAAIKEAKHPVSLHIRRGDYVENAHTNSVHGTCEPEYYLQAMRIIDALSGGRAHYFVFSDDPGYARSLMAGKVQCTIVSGNADRPWEDLMLMAACRDNIIANSSFSWWAAWLNKAADKMVIAPRRWFRRDTLIQNNTVDLYPDGWITL